VNDLLTLWTIRLSCALYVAALLGFAWRWTWTTGLAAYLLHVAAAFSLHHHWSHDAALRDTARQTNAMFGVDSGFGLYFNYAFTAIWLADVAWMWLRPDSYRKRASWLAVSIHAFMAFMFFNATVVFASGWTRWLGLAATVLIAGSKIKVQARN
jgi:hypothetical protein